MGSPALSFVIVLGIKIEGAERLENAKLLAPFHVFRKRSCDGFSLGLVTACAAGFFDEVVVQS
jgi:hypothetical protein